MPIAFIVLLVALLTGGGVTAVANVAKPGDALYGYKLSVNEPIRSALALSDVSKAKVETDLADRRLSEAEKVAVQGTLSTDVRQNLEDNFQAHATRVAELVAALQAKKDFHEAANANADLGTSLDAHVKILSTLSATSTEPEEKKSLEDLNDAVKAESKKTDALDSSIKTDVSDEASPNVQAAAEGRKTSTENKIAEVQKYLDSVKDKIDAATMAKAVAQLDTAKKSLAAGQIQLDGKLFAAAFTLFSDAHKQAQAAKSMTEAKNELNLDIDLKEEGKDVTEPIERKEASGTIEQQKQESETQREAQKNAAEQER